MRWITKQKPARESERADDFVDSYVSWREACEDVRAAYARWTDGFPDERGLAFENYLAALEREEQAAWVHSACARALRP